MLQELNETESPRGKGINEWGSAYSILLPPFLSASKHVD